MKLARLASKSIKGFGGGIKLDIVGTYFYAVLHSEWINLTNWWADSNHTKHASLLPKSTTDVIVVENSLTPFVDLSSAKWVTPHSINTGTVGITFYSGTTRAVTCSISATSPGMVRLEGNATFNSPVNSP